MIALNKLNKYYNKGKNSEIHVINDTTLSFPDSGLVCLLGPSGCGKTTLLNVIGGLDNYDSGNVLYEGKTLSKKKLDIYRARNIGFVYQNYILFPEKTVYENLEIVLNMFSLTKEEKAKRIEEALKAVHLEKYQKRLCKMLSGGQMQRVAIARALVKSPKVVIADEPTGNLDEKNTTEIMNIIKSLSKSCLVILVTHEERLALFYADRIINIKDGKVINDELNSDDNSFVTKDDVNIYLGDLHKKEYIEDNLSIRYFYENKRPKLDLDIVFHNDTYYIYPKNSDAHVAFLDSNSEGMFIEGKKQEIKKENYEIKELPFEKLEHNEELKPMISWKNAWKEAFEFIKNIRFKHKLMLLVFFVSAILICISVGAFQKRLEIKEEEFVTFHRGTNIIYDKAVFDGSKEILPNIKFNNNYIAFDYYEQSKFQAVLLSNGTLRDQKYLDEKDLICGRKPISDNEIVIDKWIIDLACITNEHGSSLDLLGFTDYEQLIGLDISNEVTYKDYANNRDVYKYTICGISNENQGVFYVTTNGLYSYYVNYVYWTMHSYFNRYLEKDYDYHYVKTDISYLNASKDTIEIIDANTKATINYNLSNLKKGEVIIPGYYYEGNNELLLTNHNNGKETLTIIGYYDLPNNNDFYISFETMEMLYESAISSDNSYVEIINDYGNVYQEKLDLYKKQKREVNTALLIFTIILLVTSLVFLYFTIRSSLISRIYEVGVFRAIGARKRELYKIFTCEIILLLVISSVFGWLITSIVLTQYVQISSLAFVRYNVFSWIGSFLIIFLSSLLIGLIPITSLLTLTPSQILSKYDI